MSGTGLSTLQVLIYLIFIPMLGDRYNYYPCCTDKEPDTEQLGNLPKVTQQTEPGFKLSIGSRVYCIISHGVTHVTSKQNKTKKDSTHRSQLQLLLKTHKIWTYKSYIFL